MVIMVGTFTASQKELLTLLSSMQPICNKRTTLDVTESILFHVTSRELTLKGTDLEISLQASMPIESDFTETTGFLIPGKRIFELVKELDGTIQFSVSDNQIKLHSGGVDLALNIKDMQDFPPFPERIENLMNVDAAFLLGMLNKVAFMIPQNNANQALNGMLLELDQSAMSMIATDGHCLARVTSPRYTLAEEKKWLMPKRAVLELKKLLEAYPSDNIFLGTCGNQLYKGALAKEDFVPARLSREPFVKTLKRTSCLLAGQFVSTQFSFAPGKMKVSMQNKEVGALEEALPLDTYQGAHVESRFYSPYLLNGLQVFPEEQVSFYIKNNTKPIIFESDSPDMHMTYLVMPVSMNQTEG
ncbi:hypothetical protein EBZ39_08120 [bacterium]|nr:hypothetical protein [bacterium]